ncbi:hypothetical protein T265_04924 [Opisthorchis viverrini]|uniref:Uncharacterized protein n=1 Tax=Opisthorchis viverrini TaxID=6198 RepID=A0A074ZLG1_OPIVI|nr:hypothetical protein T265_04924 [Opisthorchis viverrini]KER28163.1 hypothetical protein T265_04924 [Opisthorchis viverrini]
MYGQGGVLRIPTETTSARPYDLPKKLAKESVMLKEPDDPSHASQSFTLLTNPPGLLKTTSENG